MLNLSAETKATAERFLGSVAELPAVRSRAFEHGNLWEEAAKRGADYEADPTLRCRVRLVASECAHQLPALSPMQAETILMAEACALRDLVRAGHADLRAALAGADAPWATARRHVQNIRPALYALTPSVHIRRY